MGQFEWFEEEAAAAAATGIRRRGRSLDAAAFRARYRLP